MSDVNDPNETGETLGVVSGLTLGDLARDADPEPPAERPGRAVLFISDDVDPGEVLDNVEVVRVNKDVIADQIQRRT